MARYRDFLTFYLLTFLLLGLIPILSLIFNQGSMDFASAAESASNATGIAWTSNLLSVLRLSWAEPVLLLVVLGSAVPALAAIITLLIRRDSSPWLSFFGRLLPYRNRSLAEAITTYLVIFILLIPCLFLVLALRKSTGGDYVSGVQMSMAILPSLLAIAFLDQGALLEELGWRGFAAPELQNRGVQPLKAALVVGVCWGLWHLPRDITTGVIERLGMINYLILYLPAFVLGTVAVSIIAIFFSNRLGGSVLPAIVVHGISNDAIGISGSASIIDALTPYHQITKNLPLAVIALGIVLCFGVRLGLRDNPPD